MTRALPAAAIILAALFADRGALGWWARHPSAFGADSLWTLIAGSALPVAAVALFAWLASAAARRLRAPAGVAALGLGLGAAAWSSALLGMAGWYSRASFGAVALALLALALPELRACAWKRGAPRDPWALALAALLAYALADALVRACAPPAGWDATAYHLVLPKLYLKAGRIVELPWLKDSYWPHLMQTLYGWPLAFGSESGAALLNLLLCAALVRGVYAAGRDEASPAAGWLAAALLACQPVLRYVDADAHVDGALAFFHFAACLSLWRGDFVAAALLSGLGAATKLPGLALSAALALLAWRRGKPKDAWIFFGVAAAVAAPWYLKTRLETGNPVWPFLSSFFGGAGDPSAVAAALRGGFDWSFPRDWGLLLNRYEPERLLLPLALGLGFGAAARRKLPGFVRFLWWPALPYLLVVGPTREAWRYLLPVMPALALTAAWGLSAALEKRGWRRGAAAAAVLFAAWPALRASQNNELFAVLGLRSEARPGTPAREVYLERTLDYYPLYRRINETLRPSDRVLLFREVRGYYLDVDYAWGEPYHQRLLDYRALPDARALASRLRELGFTHLLIHDEPRWYGWDRDFYDEHSLGLMRALISSAGAPELADGPYALYRLPKTL